MSASSGLCSPCGHGLGALCVASRKRRGTAGRAFGRARGVAAVAFTVGTLVCLPASDQAGPRPPSRPACAVMHTTISHGRRVDTIQYAMPAGLVPAHTMRRRLPGGELILMEADSGGSVSPVIAEALYRSLLRTPRSFRLTIILTELPDTPRPGVTRYRANFPADHLDRLMIVRFSPATGRAYRVVYTARWIDRAGPKAASPLRLFGRCAAATFKIRSRVVRPVAR